MGVIEDLRYEVEKQREEFGEQNEEEALAEIELQLHRLKNAKLECGQKEAEQALFFIATAAVRDLIECHDKRID